MTIEDITTQPDDTLLPLTEAAQAAVVNDSPAPDDDDTHYGLSDTLFDAIISAEHGDDWLTVEKEVLDLEPADIAQLIEKASRDDAVELVRHLHGALDSEVYAWLGPERLRQLFDVLAPREIGAIIADLETDDAIRLIEDFDEDTRKEILRHVNQQISALVEEGLSFPEESAGRLMHRSVVAVPHFWTVGKALDYIQGLGDDLPEQFYDIFIVDPRHRVVGQVAIGQMLRVARTHKIEALKHDTIHVVEAATDREEVAALFKRVALTSVAVVDDAERLIGMITVDDIVTVVEEEAGEDLLLLGGVRSDDLAQGTLRTSYDRFKWLFVNLLTALLASYVVGHFEDALSKIVALAVLMPIVAGMGGNAGTQTLTVAVRALATKELSAANYWRVTMKETMVGVLNGLAFAVIMGIVAWLWFHDPKLGMVIGAAMVINLFAAGFSGAVIPIGLDRIGVDPAISSAIFLTTVTDCVGFLSFLGLATIFLLH